MSVSRSVNPFHVIRQQSLLWPLRFICSCRKCNFSHYILSSFWYSSVFLLPSTLASTQLLRCYAIIMYTMHLISTPLVLLWPLCLQSTIISNNNWGTVLKTTIIARFLLFSRTTWNRGVVHWSWLTLFGVQLMKFAIYFGLLSIFC